MFTGFGEEESVTMNLPRDKDAAWGEGNPVPQRGTSVDSRSLVLNFRT